MFRSVHAVIGDLVVDGFENGEGVHTGGRNSLQNTTRPPRYQNVRPQIRSGELVAYQPARPVRDLHYFDYIQILQARRYY